MADSEDSQNSKQVDPVLLVRHGEIFKSDSEVRLRFYPNGVSNSQFIYIYIYIPPFSSSINEVLDVVLGQQTLT